MSVDRDLLMFAAMTTGELNRVDKLMETKNSAEGSINKMNINALIQGSGTNLAVKNNPAFQGYIPEEVVRRMAPDTSSSAQLFQDPVNVSITDVPSQSPAIALQATVPTAVASRVIPQVSNTEMTELAEDIKTIKSTLLRIDSTFTKISGMLGKVFNFITQKETLNK